MPTINAPEGYGYVVLACGVLPTVVNLLLSGPVMSARKKYNVKYPNLYAVPGFHKEADEFNRVQRGHQNYLELAPGYTVMSLIGGLENPISVAVGGVLYAVGSMLYMHGYADLSLDVKMARYKKGAHIKWIGFFTSLVTSVKMGGKMCNWW